MIVAAIRLIAKYHRQVFLLLIFIRIFIISLGKFRDSPNSQLNPSLSQKMMACFIYERHNQESVRLYYFNLQPLLNCIGPRFIV